MRHRKQTFLCLFASTAHRPPIGADGQSISFAGATVSAEAGVPSVSYDAGTNQITVSNILTGSRESEVTVTVPYQLPVSDGEVKISRLRIRFYVKEQEEESYTIAYDWGTDAPAGQTVPSDDTEYPSLEAAKAAVDTTFTDQTSVVGEKDGKEGVWTFSGWTVKVNGRVLNVSGSWTFAENHQHDWGQPTYIWSEDGKNCTAERVCAGDASHVERAAAVVTGQVEKPATCTAPGQTTYTAVFSESWAQTRTKTVADLERLPHSWSEEWTSDDSNHWRVCAACGATTDEAEHDFVWVTDQGTTGESGGVRHQECKVCGYALPAEEETVPSNPPHTGDAGNGMFWAVLGTAAFGLGAVLCAGQRQRKKITEKM